MKRNTIGVILLVWLAPLMLFAYGVAGPDKWVQAGESVMLTGSGTPRSGYKITAYKWTQTAGPTAIIQGSTSRTPTIIAPILYEDTRLTFMLRRTEMNLETKQFSGISDWMGVNVGAAAKPVEEPVIPETPEEPEEPVEEGRGTLVGATKGTFSTSQGTASYGIKIDVPPGVSGMEPKLSLNYSSGSGNGYMGEGWSQEGVSVITRCPQTRAVDGENHVFGVNYNSDDRFCLDGQRLIAVSGEYGAVDTEYRTEIDTYSKIISRESHAGGPKYFEVKTKSGLTYIYGNGNDSAMAASLDDPIGSWSVTSIKDTYENAIEFFYIRDFTLGSHYLDKVTYADNIVQYTYETREDVIKGYHFGSPTTVDKRLKSVSVGTGTDTIRRYEITYTNETTGSKRSLISSIREFAGEEGLEAVLFTLDESGENSFKEESFTLPGTNLAKSDGKDNGTRLADLNGDGFIDIIQLYMSNSDFTGIQKVYLGDGKSFSYDETYSTGLSNIFFVEYRGLDMGTRLQDINGDGLPDLVQSYFRSGFTKKRVYLNDGTKFFYSESYSASLASKNTYFANGSGQDMGTRLEDINGDGLTDVIQLYTPHPDLFGGATQRYVYLNNGSEFVLSSTYTDGLNAGYLPQVIFCDRLGADRGLRLGDINGDGLVDLIKIFNGETRFVFLNNGERFYYNGEYSSSLPDTYFAAYNSDNPEKSYVFGTELEDINGDGLVDLVQLYLKGGGTQRRVYLNTGKKFVYDSVYSEGLPDTYIQYAGSQNMGTEFGDLNGDGLVDIIQLYNATYFYGASPRKVVYLNTGKGFEHSSSFTANLSDIYFKNSSGQDQGTRLRDINGDGTADLIQIFGSTQRVYLNQTKEKLLTAVSNNTDQDIEVTYKHMSDAEIYHNYTQNGERNAYDWNNIANDNIEITSSVPLVHTVSSANGVGGKNTVRYKYYGYVINKLRGSQGFHQVETYDETDETYSQEIYMQIEKPLGEGFQYVGMPLMTNAGIAFDETDPLSRTSIFYKDASTRSKIYEPYTYLNFQEDYDPDTKEHIKSISHYNEMGDDGLGNITGTSDQTEDKVNGKTFTKAVTNYYEAENTDEWHIGRLTKATIVHEQSGSPSIVKSSEFEYNAKGVLFKEVANAGTDLAFTKTYTYDTNGNKIQESVSGSGIQTAVTVYTYSDNGKFQTSKTNAAGLTETRTYDARFGVPTSVTGPNGSTTTFEYDAMGRKIKEIRADASVTTVSMNWDDGSSVGANNVLYSVTTSSTGKPDVTTYHDIMGREVASTSSILGKSLFKFKTYDENGQMIQESLPHYEGESVRYMTYTYDKYGRIILRSKPGPGGVLQSTSSHYSNFTTIDTNPKGQKKETVQNAIGQTISITDALGSGLDSSITYTYDAMGHPLTTTDEESNIITMIYDAQGNKVYMNDPDLGEWSYSYNAAGKLVSQINQLGQRTVKSYDILGRPLVSRTDEGESYHETTYVYADESAPKGSRGKLISTTATSKLGSDNLSTQRVTTTYDPLGRPSSTTTYISGRGEYTSSVSYDSISRPNTLTYPNGYQVTNTYNDGILTAVTGSDQKVHYKIDAINAFGSIEQGSFANGVQTKNLYDVAGFNTTILSGVGLAVLGSVQRLDYTYDTLGNVIEREDTSIEGEYIGDSFAYDALNRLVSQNTESDIIGNYEKSKVYQYDKLGNMTFQTGIGEYTYYEEKPHAVKTAGDRSYTYDALGNMVERNGDSITYNPLNKPAIMRNGSTGKKVYFYYGAGGARYMKSAEYIDTYYLGKGYEERVNGSEETQICYISLGGKTIGTHTEVINTQYPSTHEYYRDTPFNRYFHTDALGSITAITDDNGNVVERRSYEPFGKIRAMDYQTNDNSLTANRVVESTRAFTGHEQIDEIPGLIHMNARVYDSDIGRFLSADTILQYPYSSQGYNRYSYIENNPLAAPDPSGHGWWSKLKKKLKKALKKATKWVKKHFKTIITIAAVVAVVAFTAGTAGAAVVKAAGLKAGTTAAAVVKGATAGAIGGFTGGVIGTKLNGGSWRDAFKNGIKGAAAGAITGAVGGYYGNQWDVGRVLAQGGAGGVGSEIVGGDFKDGFIVGAGVAAVQWGYSEMTKSTNELKLKSVDGDVSKIKKNSYGEWDTTGARGVGGVEDPYASKLGEYGMRIEGEQLQEFDSPFNRFVNKTSKTHDYMNSWHYNHNTGFFQPFTNQIGAELFEVYSFAGMPVAGAYTAVALGGNDLVLGYHYGKGK